MTTTRRESAIRDVLDRVKLGELWHWVQWNVDAAFDGDGEHIGSLLQMVYQEHDVNDPDKSIEGEWQYTRRWFIELTWTNDEILRTVRKCALGSMEHSVGEHMTFDGVRIYDPHRKLTP